MNHLLINSNGQIFSAQANTPGTILAPWGSQLGLTTVPCTDADIALAIPATGTPAAYWNGTQVVASPASPGTAYTWDWPSKTWVLNLTVGQLAAWARIKIARDAAIDAGVTYGGNVYDSDATAQLRVTGAATLAQLAIASGNTTYSITWTLQNNSTVTLSAQQVIAMAQAVGTNYQTQFAKGQTLRAQIMAATTQAQLDAVVW